MILNLRAENFKSWHETGEIKFAPLTGFFGSNSSSKTAILQLLLMLKQTVEESDRQRVLGTRGPYIDLGTFSDIVSDGKTPGKISFSLDWNLAKPLEILDPEGEPEQIAALYFCETDSSGKSQLTALELDTFGNIRNWPKDFFGDELGEIAAKTTAEMRRKMEAAAE